MILENDDIVFTGRQVNGDCNRLRKLGVRIKQSLELRALALKHDPIISLKVASRAARKGHPKGQLDSTSNCAAEDACSQKLSHARAGTKMAYTWRCDRNHMKPQFKLIFQMLPTNNANVDTANELQNCIERLKSWKRSHGRQARSRTGKRPEWRATQFQRGRN